MNNKPLFPTVALASLFACAGFGQSSKLDTPSKFETPTGPVQLKLKWMVGEHVVQDFDMKQNMEIVLPGQPGPMKQNMSLGQKYAITVLKESPGGGHELELEFLSARMGMGMGGTSMMDYDSTKPTSAESANPIAGIFGKIVGSKIHFFMNGSDDVERMEGVDELVKRLEADGPAAGLGSLKNMYSEGYFKQMMSSSRFLPPKPVRPGDSWPVRQEFPMGDLGTMVMDYTLTLESWEMHGKRNCARLKFQGGIKSLPSQNPSPNGMSMAILGGKSSGVSWFDPELGITIETTMNQEMKMSMTLPANLSGNSGATGGSQTMTNQLSQVLTTKLDSVK